MLTPHTTKNTASVENSTLQPPEDLETCPALTSQVELSAELLYGNVHDEVLVLRPQLVDQDSGKESIPDLLETEEVHVRKFGAHSTLQTNLAIEMRNKLACL